MVCVTNTQMPLYTVTLAKDQLLCNKHVCTLTTDTACLQVLL